MVPQARTHLVLLRNNEEVLDLVKNIRRKISAETEALCLQGWLGGRNSVPNTGGRGENPEWLGLFGKQEFFWVVFSPATNELPH